MSELTDRLEVLEADITKLDVDAIVNAANQALLGGGGVDGAIHRAAGPGLLEECRRLPEVEPGVRCPTGQARLTHGHNLPARYVIHTVGPVWHDGATSREDQLLAACYRHSLALASQHHLRTIAFPAISTGVYRFPLERATRLAVAEVVRFLAKDEAIQKVIFCCFGRETTETYQRVVSALTGPAGSA